MNGLFQNFRFGLRLLRRSPGFTAVAVITLALGIGATTAIYSVVYATLLAPLPYPNPDQLVVVWSKINGDRNGVSAGDYLDWKRQSTVFQNLGAWTGRAVSLSTSGPPEQVQAEVATPGFITLMGVRLFLGREFLHEEGEVGKDNVVVLTYRFWEQRFGADRNIIGRQIRMDGKPYTVVGISEPGPYDRLEIKVYVPLSFKPEQINHDFHWLAVMGRLKPGVSLKQANSQMDGVARRIAEAYPSSNKSWGVSVEPLHNDFFPRDTQRLLWLLLGAVGFVLLIACANVANLLLAKGTTRLKEVAVRSALGATRRHVFTQFLAESLVLAFLGGVLGVGLGAAMLRVLMANMPEYTLPSEADVRLNLPVLLFTLAATTLAGVFFGCAPAWHASRVDPNETLKEGGRSGTSVGRYRLRRILIAGEFALALTLLAGAGLAVHSFWNLAHVNPGVLTEHILTFSLPMAEGRLTQPEQVVTFYRQLLEKVESLPGVVRAEASTSLPLRATGFGMPFSIAGQPVSDLSSRPFTGFQMVTPGYFQTFGIQMVKGRSFTEKDGAGAIRVAVVNETFVKRHLSGIDPLTQRIVVEQLIPGVTQLGPPVEWQIVGVFRDVRHGSLRREQSELDVPLWQSPWPQVAMAVRTAGDPEQLTKSIAAVVGAADPDLPLANLMTMDQIVDESLLSDQFNTTLYGCFAGVALVLAAVGIYGVMAFAVAQRTHEIGLRMALGAARKQVLGLILKEGIILALIGLGLGLIGACFVGRAMRGMLFGVGTIDFAAFAAVAAMLLTAALLACYLPARRASRVDPMVALRYE